MGPNCGEHIFPTGEDGLIFAHECISKSTPGLRRRSAGGVDRDLEKSLRTSFAVAFSAALARPGARSRLRDCSSNETRVTQDARRTRDTFLEQPSEILRRWTLLHEADIRCPADLHLPVY